MRLTASRLRQDIYRILDRVLDTGVPVEIARRGKVLRIVPPEETSKLDSLPRRDVIRGDPQELVQVDWSDSWEPDA